MQQWVDNWTFSKTGTVQRTIAALHASILRNSVLEWKNPLSSAKKVDPSCCSRRVEDSLRVGIFIKLGMNEFSSRVAQDKACSLSVLFDRGPCVFLQILKIVSLVKCQLR